MANVKIIIECEEEYALEALRKAKRDLQEAMVAWPTEGTRTLLLAGDEHMSDIMFYYSDKPGYPKFVPTQKMFNP